MKKISFGSFPFINIDKKTRNCLDKYLIKTFADQIVLTDIFKNLNSAKDFVYLTPEAIIDSLYNFNSHRKNNRSIHYTRGFYESALDYITYDNEFMVKEGKELIIFESEKVIVPIKQDFLIPLNTKTEIIEESSKKDYKKDNKPRYYDPYMSIIKRAFFIMKKFYEKLANDPFYKDYIILPVYSEKLIDIDPTKLNRSQYEYSFFILTNDLLHDLKLDEVEFNDAEVINTLYIFHQLFPNKALTDFNEKDLELVIKFYAFFEKNKIDPIEFFKIIYAMIFLFAQSKTLKDFDKVSNVIFTDPKLKNIFDKPTIISIREAIIDYVKKTKDTRVITELNKYTKKDLFKLLFNTSSKTFKAQDFINIILNNSDFQKILIKIFDEFDNNPYSIKRQQVRFRNIILLFKELAKFNSKKLNDIITDAGFDLQFKIKFENKGVIYNELIIKRKIDETFANFIQDFDQYVLAFEKTLNKKITNDKQLNKVQSNAINNIISQIENIDKEIQRLYDENKMLNPNDPEYLRNEARINELLNQKSLLITQLNAMEITDFITNPATRDRIRSNYFKDNTKDLKINSKNYDKYEKIVSGYSVADKDNYAFQNHMYKNTIPSDVTQTSTQPDYTSDQEFGVKYNINQKYKNSFNPEYAGTEEFGIPFELSVAKTELGELYRTLYRNLTNEVVLSAYLTEVCEGFNLDERSFKEIVDKFKLNEFSIGSDSYLIGQFFNDIYIDIASIVDVLIDKVKADLESKLQALMASEVQNKSIKERLFEGLKKIINSLNNEWDQYRENMIKSALRFLINRVLKVICRHVQRDVKQGEVNFKETVRGLHPLLAKLAKNPNHFKSFIFGFDMLLNLYDLLYLTELQKYYAGWSIYQRPLIDLPMRYKNPKNKIDFVIDDIFKLKDNPLWIVGKSELYLSLPDYMSLVRSRIFTKIPKNKIRDYCRISYEKIMSDKNMGKLLTDKDQGQLIAELRKKINKLEHVDKEIKKLEEKKKKNKKNFNKNDEIRLKDLKDEKFLLVNEIKVLKAQINALSNGNKNDDLALTSLIDQEF